MGQVYSEGHFLFLVIESFRTLILSREYENLLVIHDLGQKQNKTNSGALRKIELTLYLKSTSQWNITLSLWDTDKLN